ncbi:hypothetical protein K457DRAFT_1587021 [Linnemannia elongata AG-77]|uniref:Transmembrane protein n=1 Tax=Linnemannia elongata AG-77 TaxID=1314771 RepID=A0A197JNX9_9FUNG|nr:hypothetical protein K457DRAFT_1587021 [Linnemannia elongata AG-77]
MCANLAALSSLPFDCGQSLLSSILFYFFPLPFPPICSFPFDHPPPSLLHPSRSFLPAQSTYTLSILFLLLTVNLSLPFGLPLLFRLPFVSFSTSTHVRRRPQNRLFVSPVSSRTDKGTEDHTNVHNKHNALRHLSLHRRHQKTQQA